MIFGMCFGFLLGALVINLYLKDAEKTNESLKKTINNLEDDIDLANFKIKNRDRIIEELQSKNKELISDGKSAN
mgnify:CR=1 FL=1